MQSLEVIQPETIEDTTKSFEDNSVMGCDICNAICANACAYECAGMCEWDTCRTCYIENCPKSKINIGGINHGT